MRVIASLRYFTLFVFLLGGLQSHAQTKNEIIQRLVEEGFTNVRYAETVHDKIYTIENDRYKIASEGIKAAVNLIEEMGLDSMKTHKIIVTQYNVPQVAVIREPYQDWTVSEEIGEAWKWVKDEKVTNSSLFKVDLKIYPQVAFQNLIITQIYQWLIDFNPSLEVSLWPGGKLAAMIKVPVYNDGYGIYEGKVHPGNITLSQRFRLFDKVTGRVAAGYFSNDRYGFDAQAKYYLPDSRFSVEGRIGYVGIGYWDGFNLHYDKTMRVAYTLQGNFFWPQYNTQFTVKWQKWLLNDQGIKFEMIRHFRYTSIGFYAMRATDKGASSNGGFRFQGALPPYKQNRFKNKYLPKVTTAGQMGIVYNAGNERYYYKEYKAEASDNIMEANQFNPIFIQNELRNRKYSIFL